MGTLVLARKTPLTKSQILSAVIQGYQVEAGRVPPENVALLLAAQVMGETARGTAIWNYNFGNIKKSRLWTGDWTTFECGENLGDGHRLYPAGSPQCIFRAHSTAAEGARWYVRVIHNRSAWWAALHTEDPYQYNAALAEQPYAYYTADKEKYGKLLRALFTELGGVPVELPTLVKQKFSSVGTPVEPALLPVLRRSSAGAAVALWQGIIGAQGDGRFGPITEETTRHWQNARGLLPDGIVGPRSWRNAP